MSAEERTETVVLAHVVEIEPPPPRVRMAVAKMTGSYESTRDRWRAVCSCGWFAECSGHDKAEAAKAAHAAARGAR